MSRAAATAVFLIHAVAASAGAQTPTGSISGVVTDASGSVAPDVRITITNLETRHTRTVTTRGDGWYSVEALPPGVYHVTAAAAGFKLLERLARVEVGASNAVNLTLEVGDVSEKVTVTAGAPLLHNGDHQLGGTVTRDQIEAAPLNGRNFLELAKLEPGVTTPVRLNDGRTFVSVLGAGLQTIPRVGSTRVTVDGASITTPGTAGTLFQLSQDVVHEFRLSQGNFDAATSPTSNGAVNIVTRAGGNAYHGGGLYFYRGHDLAAYPALRRDRSNPDPFFERRQYGGSAGGPILKDRAFFFTSYERTDQQGVVSVQPVTPEFVPLGGIFRSPYLGNLFSARIDVRVGRNHSVLVRHTHDGSRAFEGSATVLPSGWSRRVKSVNQSLAALTSVLSSTVINDVRLSYLISDSGLNSATEDDCPGCLGLGAPRLVISDAGLSLGASTPGTLSGRRVQLTDSVTWQRGDHRIRAGFDWEHAVASDFSLAREPAQITVWSPGRARQINPEMSLPGSFAALDDFLRLPLRSFETGVGPGTVPWPDLRTERVLDQYRLYAEDTWRAGRALTISGGVGWSYEPNSLNYDLTKPPLLEPILGSNGLTPPSIQLGNVSPMLGFVWTATGDGRTIVRGGGGRYYDPVGSTNLLNLENERLELSPLGTGRFIVSGRNILHDGRRLDFPQPTSFTAADLLALLPGIRAGLIQSLNANPDSSVRNIDATKEGENLYDPAYATPYAVHASLGVQRELSPGFVVSADLVWKHFVHTFINGIDYNRWSSAGGPVVPACTGEQRNDVRAVCSNGSLFFDTTVGRARYKGLLVRVEKRFSGRWQFLASYALGSYAGTNGTGTGTTEASGGRVFGFNNDNWFENYGPLPTDERHILNLSGTVVLPWRIQIAGIVSAYSRPPFAAYVSGADFNGDGTENDLLPGTTINQFGRGLDRGDLQRLVAQYNQRYPLPLTLPDRYSFDDNFFTQDVRVSRSAVPGRSTVHVTVFAEVFNLLNTANLTGFSGNLANPATFGQPAARIPQVFGSGGPRAFQFGTRISF